MKKEIKIGLVVILVLIISLLVINITGYATLQNKEDIVIGFIAPLSGPASSYGAAERNIVKSTIEQINLEGGINNRQVRIIYEDGKCDGIEALKAAKKLIELDKVNIILGGACSGETLGIAPYTQEKKVILFSAISSNPQISNAGDYIFRNVPSDTYFVNATVDYLKKEGITKVALISEQGDYGQGARALFKKMYEEEIVSDETYNLKDTDVRTQLTKIKARDFQALIIVPQTGDDLGLILKQAKEIGINTKTFSLNLFGDTAYEIAKEGIIGLTYSDNLSVYDNSKGKELLKDYKEKHQNPPIDYMVASRYDSINIIVDAIKKCKTDKDTECIRDYILSIEEYQGAAGTYSFDEFGDIHPTEFMIHKVVGIDPPKTESKRIILK